MYFKTEELAPNDIYRYLVGGVVPRPIAWVSTLNSEGVSNIAPYSFFTVASINPPILTIAHIAPQAATQKDTLANLKATQECVVNIVSHDQVKSMNASSSPLPNNISEFETFDIGQANSIQVKPVGAAGAKVRFECQLREILSLSEQPAGGQLILLNVVGIYIDDKILNADKLIDQNQLDAIGKMGADGYCKTTLGFDLPRPK